MPLSDGRVYCYAAAPTDPGIRARDELDEMVRLFGVVVVCSATPPIP
jgi:hypothetical protein